MKGQSVTPDSHHLFDVAEDATKLFRTNKYFVRHFVAQRLYLSKRACPDIQLEVSLLCNRAKDTSTNDKKKLERVTKYLQGTIGIPLILSIDKSGNIKWYVDAECAVYMDTRSHTGGFTTIGTVGSYVQFSKQKMNTKISAEAELVRVDDVLTKVICTGYLLKEQGYEIHGNVIYQDNQSSIKLEKNGIQSSSNRTRHIKTRYYFITDNITNQEEYEEFCPTLDIIRDYFTKELQGSQFRHFLNIICHLYGYHKLY